MKASKVVELGVWVAGPAAGGILADWGADVIKIEPPTGDPGPHARGAYTVSFDLATQPLDEWAKVFAAEPDFFWAPINSIEDVIADEQFHAAGGVVYVPDDDSTVPMIATPADFHGTPWEPRSAAPELGEHTDEILAELAKTAFTD